MQQHDDEDDSPHGAEGGKQNGEWEEWGEEDEQPAVCLFCPKTFGSLEAAIEHSKELHDIDIKEKMKKLGVRDEYGAIKMINSIRSKIGKHCCPQCASSFDSNEPLLQHMKTAGHSFAWEDGFNDDESLLRPVLANDPFLFAFWGDDDDDNGNVDETDAAASSHLALELKKENAQLRDHIAQLEAALLAARDLALNDLDQQAKSIVIDEAAVKKTEQSQLEQSIIQDDQCYFASYGNFGIHYDMINDKIRTEAYRDFLLKNPSQVSGKIVLDVGCGTGILSMFAAQGGALQVVGVDMADILDFAIQNVYENRLDNRVLLLKGKLEDVHLPAKQVNLIVSEWMGYFLLYESMLDTVIYARDRWLAPGGSVQPSKASMYLCAVEDSTRVNFWDNVYGFSMMSIKHEIYRNGIREPTVDVMDSKGILSSHALIKSIDTATVTKEDCDFTSAFQLKVEKNGYCHSFVGYFDVQFDGCENPITLSTSLLQPPTHWKQTIFYLQDPVSVQAGWIIKGEIKVCRNRQSPRRLDINIQYVVEDDKGKVMIEPRWQQFDMH